MPLCVCHRRPVAELTIMRMVIRRTMFRQLPKNGIHMGLVLMLLCFPDLHQMLNKILLLGQYFLEELQQIFLERWQMIQAGKLSNGIISEWLSKILIRVLLILLVMIRMAMIQYPLYFTKEEQMVVTILFLHMLQKQEEKKVKLRVQEERI